MGAAFDARYTQRPDSGVQRTPATNRPTLLTPQQQVTVLEHAFRAVRDDPPGANPEELAVHGRLRNQLLEAAVAQFAGRSNGLARAGKSGGTLLLTEDCGACGGWRITCFDEAMSPDGHDHYDDELEAIRALLIAVR
jgi:hypothetical protein